MPIRAWLAKREAAIRFLLAGAANTASAILIYWLLLRWISYPYAYTVSFAIGILTGYALNTYFVFRKRWSWLRLMVFPSVHLVNYAAGLGIIWIAVSMLGIDQRIAPVISAIATVPINFVMTRWVITHRR